jgi:cell division protein FtsI/penicillin-binding protein 2
VTKSLADIKRLMQQLIGTDPASIDAALHAPGVQPNWFVPVATVPDDARYTTVLRPRLYPLAGLSFRREKGVLTTSPGLAPLVGRVGEITAERLKELGAPYRTGDQVGLTGLQAAYEKQLAGTPTADVVVEAGAKVVRRVERFRGKVGQAVRLTVDPRLQQAGDAALTGVAQPAALVAIDVRNGQLLAVVSKPDGGFNRALAGTYEPGSTFKVVTSAALLATGSTGATPAPCPPTLQVYGRVFKNFEGEASGALDLASAFKISCNNAFIGLADKLPDGALARAATQFGFNAKSALPPPAAGGSFPTPKDRAELAASAIGQGRVLVSPAHMASVAAAVAAGQWHAPVLTIQPKPKVPKVPPLDAGVAATLRAFMASVPQPGGTAAGAGLPPGTFGKTGTAEFGNANPPQTHAWFIGFRGNLAFAVVVEGGGVGGRVAAPLAARFLNSVP